MRAADVVDAGAAAGGRTPDRAAAARRRRRRGSSPRRSRPARTSSRRTASGAVLGRPAREVDLTDDDQGDDAQPGEPRDDLSRPLVQRPVPDERQREGRVEDLAVGGDQGEEERAEPDEDEPVHDADERPHAEPGVPQRLDEHAVRAGAGAPAPRAVRRPKPDHSHEVRDAAHEERHADDGGHGEDRDRRDLQGGQVHVGSTLPSGSRRSGSAWCHRADARSV